MSFLLSDRAVGYNCREPATTLTLPSPGGRGENAMENVISQHITKTPGVCGGRPCIAGHRIRVQDIVVWHEMRG